jgi:hypothetical protein
MDATAKQLQAEVDRLNHELQTLKVHYHCEDDELITISEYILKRLEQLNVTVCVPFMEPNFITHLLPTVHFRSTGGFQHAYGFIDHR